MSATNYMEELIINDILRTGTKYIALFTSSTTEAGTGTEVSTSGTAYARQVITFDAPSQVDDKAQTQNSSVINFPQATAAWGTVTHWAVFDALTGGNMYVHGQLSVSKIMNSGDSIDLAAGDVKITCS